MRFINPCRKIQESLIVLNYLLLLGSYCLLPGLDQLELCVKRVISGGNVPRYQIPPSVTQN